MPAERDLECDLLYSVIVAGKSAKFADTVIRRLDSHRMVDEGWFAMVRRLVSLGRLEAVLRAVRSGNYGKVARAFMELAHHDPPLDLTMCTCEVLERIHGIGPKTSRFFILWTRPGAEHAALDVHVLRWLNKQGYKAPKSTPASGRTYKRLEEIFIAEAKKRSLTPRELDFQIWADGSRYTGEVQSL